MINYPRNQYFKNEGNHHMMNSLLMIREVQRFLVTVPYCHRNHHVKFEINMLVTGNDDINFRDDAGNILASVEKNSRCSKTTAWVIFT